MSASRVTCPQCGTSIDVEALLEHQTEERVRAEYERRFAVKLEQEKQDIAAQVKRKTLEESETRLKAIELELHERTKENRAFKQRELELLKVEQQLKSANEEMELRVERRVFDERDKIEKQAREFAEQHFELKQRELQKQIDDQRKLVDEMKRKAEQGSQQLQGEVLELVIEEFLAATFPFDTIEPVGKGQRGADCLLRIGNGSAPMAGSVSGTYLGTILIESKRTKTFQAEWLKKLKDDMMSTGASIGVIVTETLPKDVERFGSMNGIWVCRFDDFKPLIHVLRSMIVQVAESTAAQENKGDKMSMLYSYLTSNEFRLHVEGIVEGFQTMKQDLDKERSAMERIWKQREKQLDRVLLSTVHMVGSIKGIAGAEIPSIRSLELP